MIKILIKINQFLDKIIWKHFNKLRIKRIKNGK
jgi:hypothetical protein